MKRSLLLLATLIGLLLPGSAMDLMSGTWNREGIRPVPTQDNGMVLQLPFKRDDRQVMARRPGNLDLSRHTSFRLQAAVENPKALLEGTLEFVSGNGGYRAPFTLHQPGPQQIFIPKRDFKPHGSPKGWGAIREVRLSFWPRSTGTTTLRQMKLEARKDEVWIVDAESVSQNADETYTARIATRHLTRVCRELGLPHSVVDLQHLTRPEEAKLLLFSYLPRIPDTTVNRLKSASETGTKIVVWEGNHAGLARLLGANLGPLLSSHTVGQFNGLRFNSTTWIDPPDHLIQHAWSYRKLTPMPGSFVLARWEDSRERVSGDAAAILSQRGAWLNTAWRSGDVETKADALRALIAYLKPWVLRESVTYHRFTASPAAFDHRHPPPAQFSGPAKVMRNRAEMLFKQANLLAAEQKLVEALRGYRASKTLLRKAHASSIPPWTPGVRGIWDQQGTGFYAGGWEETCKELKAAGLNALFANMATSGRAHYPSAIIPGSKTLETHGDQLKAFSHAARRHGLQAHAWKICWKVNSRDAAFRERLKTQGRLMMDAEGNPINWLSLSDPRNVQLEVDAALEMLRHAPLDGLHLDYMRYPGREADYGPAARKAFERQLGRTLPQWPKEVLGPLKARYQRFRQQEVHRAVETISRAVRAEFPDVILSVAVWGAWPDCADAQGQDWPVWGKNGWIDWLIPMNYTDNLHQFEGWMDLQRRQPGLAEKLVPGIGLISSNAELGPTDLLDQLQQIRKRNLKGFVLYRLDTALKDRTFPYLKPMLTPTTK